MTPWGRRLPCRTPAGRGETLSVSKTPHGIELSVRDPDFDAEMAAAREVMGRRKHALRELAATEKQLARWMSDHADMIMRDDSDVLGTLAKN